MRFIKRFSIVGSLLELGQNGLTKIALLFVVLAFATSGVATVASYYFLALTVIFGFMAVYVGFRDMHKM